jgi:hypothetical protein
MNDGGVAIQLYYLVLAVKPLVDAVTYQIDGIGK